MRKTSRNRNNIDKYLYALRGVLIIVDRELPFNHVIACGTYRRLCFTDGVYSFVTVYHLIMELLIFLLTFFYSHAISIVNVPLKIFG